MNAAMASFREDRSINLTSDEFQYLPIGLIQQAYYLPAS
jgi:hypothetical protein